ncbi:MAG: response regulator transcription factor [Bdellovibrionaceae bacterium]|nr:response regulator transcription factor [Pseudobdellovibrionaceae bacterium]
MTSKHRVLIIDDDSMVCEMIVDLLSSRYDVSMATNVEEGERHIASQKPDLLILDIKLKNESGLDLCKKLRENPATSQMAILIYSGSEDIEMLTTAFERGADDYVAKSARPQELIARIAAKIRRVEERNQENQKDGKTGLLVCGNLELDDLKIEARIDGKTMPLSVLEYNLLRFFVVNKERVMSRAQILAGVWKDSIVSNRTIDTHMVYLRKKLVGFDHTFGTVYGAGYILRTTPAGSAEGEDTLGRDQVS